jgi:hypothetical protein
MAINDEAARDLAKAMIEAGRSTSFILQYVSVYFGDVAMEAALAAIEAHGNTLPAEGVVSPN